MRTAAAALIALALLAGCNDDQEQPQPAPLPQQGVHSPEGVMIRDWLRAVKVGDYDHAAEFFARGAIIDQGRPIRLPDAAAAKLFSQTLPCHADLIALEDEGAMVLATFHLLPGPGGPCAGRVKVRYTIKDGKFTQWLQLPSAPEPRPEPEPEPEGPVV